MMMHHPSTIDSIEQQQQHRLALCVAILSNECHLIFADDLSSLTIRPRFDNCCVGRWFRVLSSSNCNNFALIENERDMPFPTRFVGNCFAKNVQVQLPICFLPDLSLFGWPPLDRADRNKFYCPLVDGVGQVTCELDWRRIEKAHRYEAFLSVEIDSVRHLPKWTLSSADHIFGFSKTFNQIDSSWSSNCASSVGVLLRIVPEYDRTIGTSHYCSVIIRRHPDGRLAFGRIWQENLSLGDIVDFVSVEASCAAAPRLLLALDIARSDGIRLLNDVELTGGVEYVRDNLFLLRVPLTMQLLASVMRSPQTIVGTVQLANFGTLIDSDNVIGQLLGHTTEDELRLQLVQGAVQNIHFHVRLQAKVCFMPDKVATFPAWALVGVPSVERFSAAAEQRIQVSAQGGELSGTDGDEDGKTSSPPPTKTTTTTSAAATAVASKGAAKIGGGAGPGPFSTSSPSPTTVGANANVGGEQQHKLADEQRHGGDGAEADGDAGGCDVEEVDEVAEEVRLELEQDALVLFTDIRGWDLHMRFFLDREGKFTSCKCCNRLDLPSNYANTPPPPGSWASIVYTEDSPLSVRHIVIRRIQPLPMNATLGATLRFAMQTVRPDNARVWAALSTPPSRACSVQQLLDRAAEEADGGDGEETAAAPLAMVSAQLRHRPAAPDEGASVDGCGNGMEHRDQSHHSQRFHCGDGDEQHSGVVIADVEPRGVIVIDSRVSPVQPKPSRTVFDEANQIVEASPHRHSNNSSQSPATPPAPQRRRANASGDATSCSDGGGDVRAQASLSAGTEDDDDDGYEDDDEVEDDFAPTPPPAENATAPFPAARGATGAAEDDGWGRQSPTQWECVDYERHLVPHRRRQTRRARNERKRMRQQQQQLQQLAGAHGAVVEDNCGTDGDNKVFYPNGGDDTGTGDGTGVAAQMFDEWWLQGGGGAYGYSGGAYYGSG